MSNWGFDSTNFTFDRHSNIWFDFKMRLSEYVSIENLSIPQVAEQFNVTVEAVRSWIKGIKIPNPENMVAIYEWSNGAVTPNDFYDLPDNVKRGGGFLKDFPSAGSACLTGGSASAVSSSLGVAELPGQLSFLDESVRLEARP